MSRPTSEPPTLISHYTDFQRKERSSCKQTVDLRLKRMFDLVLGFLVLPFLGPPMAVIAFAVKLTSKGDVLYWSDRVGRNNKIFRMPKFRTMAKNTPEVATHLLCDPQAHLTAIGPFLRRTSLDELPQIYSILRGDLSRESSVACMSSPQGLRAGRRLTVETICPSLRKSNTIAGISSAERFSST